LPQKQELSLPLLKIETMKNILVGICLLAVILSFKTESGGLSEENGTLSVVATSRDAYKSLVKPDAGCVFYIGTDAELKSVIENFQELKYDYLLSISHSVDPAINTTLRDNFDTVSTYTYKFINGFRKQPGIVTGTTDRTGHVSVHLKPGKYLILFVSGTVKSDNMAERNGNIGYKIVEIKSAMETIQSVCFQKYDLTGVMIARNLSGC
jgi:hypothetical protein